MTAVDVVVLLPMLLALTYAIAALLADAFWSPRGAIDLALGGLAFSAVASAVLGSSSTRVVFGVLRAGGGVARVSAWLLAFAALALLAARPALATRANGGQVAALAAFSGFAAVALVSAADLLVLVLALETLALCAYGLVASARTKRSDEAALKYFVQGGVASALLVYGIAVLVMSYRAPLAYAAFDTLRIAQGPVLPFALLLSALAFKAGAFPFHWWAPDAYETSSPAVAGLLASVFKAAAIVAVVVLFAGAFAGSFAVWVPLVAALAAGSVVFGNLAGLRQVSFARMLAYSGVAQVGYALSGLAALEDAASAVVTFAAVYGLAALGAFAAAAALSEAEPHWDGTIAGMAGLARRRPALAAALTALMLSLTGIPLTAGFWGKFLVFGALATTPWAWLAVVGVIGSVVSFGYYGSVLRAMYLEEGDVVREGAAWSSSEGVAIALATLVVGIGVVPLFTGLQPLLRLVGVL